MSGNKPSAASGGIGFTGLLQIVFIVLKLCNVIEWSWWWVMVPTWGCIALVLLFIAILIICECIKK